MKVLEYLDIITFKRHVHCKEVYELVIYIYFLQLIPSLTYFSPSSYSSKTCSRQILFTSNSYVFEANSFAHLFHVKCVLQEVDSQCPHVSRFLLNVRSF